MDTLVQMSFYSFTATSMALVAATVCYLAYGIGFLRVSRRQLATNTGGTITASMGRSSVTDFSTGPSPVGIGRFAHAARLVCRRVPGSGRGVAVFGHPSRPNEYV